MSGQTQHFLSVHGIIFGHFRPQRLRTTAADYGRARTKGPSEQVALDAVTDRSIEDKAATNRSCRGANRAPSLNPSARIAGNGRPQFGLERMLRLHFQQHCWDGRPGDIRLANNGPIEEATERPLRRSSGVQAHCDRHVETYLHGA
jgi:hypothetical protein